MGSAATQVTSSLALSRDGKNVAIGRTRDGQQNVWLRNLARGSESRLAESGSAAVLSPDASRLVYTKGNDLFLLDADGGGAETPLLHNANQMLASDWSRDGRFLLYTEIDPKTGSDIWYLEDPLGKAGGKPGAFPGHKCARQEPGAGLTGRPLGGLHFQRIGRDRSLYAPVSVGSGQRRVSTDGGAEPRWSRMAQRSTTLQEGVPNH